MTKYLFIPIILVVISFGIWYLAVSSVMRREIPVTQEPPRPVPPGENSSTYSCDGGKKIVAIFREGTAAPSANFAPEAPQPPDRPIPTGSVDITLSDGRAMTLARTISADGVRYANPDESFIFWSKGNGALVLEHNEEKSYIGCIIVAPLPHRSNLTQVYSNGSVGFSIRLPDRYTIDESYTYQANPDNVFSGVQFTIPESERTGTNLSSDSYVSIETLPAIQDCTADLFFDGVHTATEKTENDTTYSVATSSGAGAGNRYEETVYALPGTDPCIAMRYFIHYSAIQNYELGTVREFDQAALLKEFDQIRSTLIVNQ